MSTIIRSGYTAHRRAMTIRVPASPSHKAYTRYQRAKSVRVSPTRVRNTGLPGKGPKTLPPMRVGALSVYGYSTSAPNSVRHKALARAARANSALSVMRRLGLVSIYTRRTIPRASRMYLANRNWVRKSLM